MNRRMHRRGAILVWVAVLMVVLIGFAGLAIDVGYGVLVSNQLQNAADAAALAGAAQVRISEADARAMAVEIANANTAAGTPINISGDADVEVGWFDRETRTFTTGGNLNAVRVVTHKKGDDAVPLLFAPLAAVAGYNLERDAIAMTEGNAGSGLLILDPTGSGALSVGGGVDLNMINGVVWVNSSAACASTLFGSARMTAERLAVVGTNCIQGSFNLTGPVTQGVGPQADPLAWLPAPTRPASGIPAPNFNPNGTYTINPGRYTTTLQVKGTVTLNPGIYYLDQGIQINANATLKTIPDSGGAMLYIADGEFRIGSGVTIAVEPPNPEIATFDEASTFDGIAIFQARDNTTAATFNVSDTSTYYGTSYFPRASVNIQAGGDNYLSRIIAWRLSFTGNSTLTLDWTGTDPAAGNVPFLVE